MKSITISKVRILLLMVVGLLCGFSPAWAEVALDPNKEYSISLNPKKDGLTPDSRCLMVDASGNLKAGALTNDGKFKWKFEKGEGSDVYYVKNVATGKYLQSTNKAENAVATVAEGKVAYRVAKDATAGASTLGLYYLCSNDQNVDNSTDGTKGLNCQDGGENVVCYFIKTGRGNSYWDVKEFKAPTGGSEVTPDKPIEDGNFSADKYYTFHRMKNTGAYAMETASGKLSSSGKDNSVKMYWKFIPTGKAGCYYIQNAVSKRYIQSTKQTLSSQIPMGDAKVEFKIGKDNTSGATTNGFYYFCSTDQKNIPAGAIGLNYDGGNTKNIVAWYAQSGDQNSYWKIYEVAFDYEPVLVPLVSGMDQVRDAARYTLSSAGQQLSVKDGALAMAPVSADDANSWVFVGTSNSKEGIYLVNMSQPTKVLTLKDGTYSFTEESEGTRWYVSEKDVNGVNSLVFVPFAQKDDVNAPKLAVGDVSSFLLGNFRSSYSLATQIYSLPCGALDKAYITKLDIKGEQVLKELNYAPKTKPTNYYNLYTVEKATVSAGQAFTLTATLTGMDADTKAFVYFDWNRDGLFETVKTYTEASISDEIAVPADAKVGKARMRVRLTNNNLVDAEDDVVGSLYDFIINIAPARDKRMVTVDVNDEGRGTAAILVGGESIASAEVEYGQEVNVVATPKNKLAFLAWKDNRTVVSTEANYVFQVTEDASLTACFSPNSSISTDLQDMQVDQKNFVYEIRQGAKSLEVLTDATVKMVYVFAMDGTQVRKSTSKKVSVAGLGQGAYIIKVITSVGDGCKKIALK